MSRYDYPYGINARQSVRLVPDIVPGIIEGFFDGKYFYDGDKNIIGHTERRNTGGSEGGDLIYNRFELSHYDNKDNLIGTSKGYDRIFGPAAPYDYYCEIKHYNIYGAYTGYSTRSSVSGDEFYHYDMNGRSVYPQIAANRLGGGVSHYIQTLQFCFRVARWDRRRLETS